MILALKRIQFRMEPGKNLRAVDQTAGARRGKAGGDYIAHGLAVPG